MKRTGKAGHAWAGCWMGTVRKLLEFIVVPVFVLYQAVFGSFRIIHKMICGRIPFYRSLKFRGNIPQAAGDGGTATHLNRCDGFLA